MTPLCELARKYETDKGGEHFAAGSVCHYYTQVYHAYLNARRPRVGRVLELGVNKGGSLRMWQEYFPNALIVGVDCAPDCLFHDLRIHCELGDETDPIAMRRIARLHGPFDVIIDDGSHEPEHQFGAAVNLFPYLKARTGLYFIEDLSVDLRDRLQEALPTAVVVRLPVKPSLGPNPYLPELLLIRPR